MTKKEKFILIDADLDEPINTTYFENELIEIANDQRKEYINDEIDSEYIKECFSDEITTFKGAKDWFYGMEQKVVLFTDKLNETQRILKRLFENNGTINGKLEEKEQKSHAGYWNFEIKILDIDDFFNMRLQLKMLKMWPSGVSDNGIKIIEHPLVSLLQFDCDMDMFIKYIIKRNYGFYYKYKITNWAI